MKKYLIHFIAVLFLSFFITEHLQGQKNLTQPSIDAPNGFTVNSFTGGLKFERQDIYIQGIGPDLDFKFSYGSNQKKRDMGFGYGWKFTYQIYYTKEDDIVVVKGVEGGTRKFFKNGQNWTAEKGVFDVLTEYEPNKFKMTSKDGTIHFFDDSTYKQLTKIEDRCSNEMNFTYSDSLLTEVTDQGGRSIQLSWTEGHLTKITNDLLAETREFIYEFDDNNNLVKVTNPLGDFTEYAYDEKHRLIRILDENNTPTLISYQQSGGVKQIASCDFAMSITYNIPQNRVYVVQQSDGERIITTYQFDPEGRIESKEGNCCGYNIAYNYDDDNNVTKRTDGNDNSKLYTFDDRGNKVGVLSAMNESESFNYSNDFNKVTDHVDQMGYETTYEYDSKGNLLLVNKPLNVSESFTYDNVGNMITHTDPNGNLTTYEYNTFGYLISKTFADNTSQQYTYDVVGNLLSETNENGNTTSYEFDKMNRLVKTTNALGYERNFIYDPVGDVIERIDERGNSTTYTYDGLRKPLSTTTAEGITTSMEYDTRGNVKTKIDGEGNIQRFKYNIRNQLIEITDPLGRTITHDYDGVGNMISQSDKMGNFMTFEFDKNNRLLNKIDPLGGTMSYVYDAKGKKIEERDPKGNSTFYEYDVLGRMVKETNALGYFIENTYDALGNKISRKDENGNVYTYQYDNRNRLILITNPLQQTIEYTYDAVGNKTSTIQNGTTVQSINFNEINEIIEKIGAMGEIETIEYDSTKNIVKRVYFDGTITNSEYDKDNRLVKKSDNHGVLAEFKYNGNNQIIEETNHLGLTTKYFFNALLRMEKVENPSGTTKLFEYDANGNLLSQIDENNNKNTISYNAVGQALESINVRGEKVELNYDENSNLISSIDSKGNITSYTYDKLNRKTSIKYSDGNSKTYVFDGVGNVIKRIDPANEVTNYTYDALLRQTAKIYPDGTSCTFMFDIQGRLINSSNVHANIDFQYDDSNRLLSETINNQEVITYNYDFINRKTNITYPSGRVIEESYDFRNRPTTVLQNGNSVATLNYTGGYMTDKSYGNGVNTNYSFDIEGRLQNITVSPDNLFLFNYGYDNLGNRTFQETLHNPNFSESYIYDETSRLVDYKKGVINNNIITNPLDNVAYNLDPLGNRISIQQGMETTTYQVNSMNAYTQVTNNQINNIPTYSPTGNILSYSSNDYTYDFENKMVAINDSIEYNYDGLGRRFEKIVGNKTIKYFYFSDQLIQENHSDGTIVEHIYAGTEDKRLSTIRNNTEQYYYHYDALKSVVGISNNVGDVLERYTYDPYGKVSIFDNQYNPLPTSMINNHFFFTGKELDNESGLYFFRARQYSAELGRFFQRDPAGYVDGMNLYQYVKSNPINLIDQYGLLSGSACHTTQKIIGTDGGKFPTTWEFLTFGGSDSGSINGSVDIAIGHTTCFECCEEVKAFGSSFTYSVNVGGTASIEYNLLSFIPQTRGLVGFADVLGFNLFGGVYARFGFSGSLSIKGNSCGETFGGGCLSVSGALGATIKIESKDNDTTLGGANGAGGYIEGVVNWQGCVTCSGGSCDTNCEYSMNIEGKVWFNVDVEVGPWKYRKNLELGFTTANESIPTGCPGFMKP